LRIGVFLENTPEQDGGGYTFENEIIGSLLDYKNSCDHTFVFFSWHEEWKKYARNTSKAKFVYIHRSVTERVLTKAKLTASTLAEKIRNPLKVVAPKSGRMKFINETLKVNKIDLLWSLCPTTVSMDIPYMMTVWDLQHRLQPYFPEVSVKGEWNSREGSYSLLLRRAALIITGTNEGKSEIERFYQVPEERVKVLPFPTPRFAIDCTLSEDDCHRILHKFQIPSRYLFYPAQFWPHKNHAGLLLALKYLKDNFKLSLPLVLTGSDKSNRSYIKKMSMELNLENQVYMLGFVTRNDLVALYKNAFALTFVSYFGPDNLPPLEAFALGCPVIASNVPGAEEQLGKAALLVDPKNPEHIALGIKNLLDNDDVRKSMIKYGIERATKWTGMDYIKAITPIFDDISKYRLCWE
jgi:glycosyltransferase involved in cell wall biosynthesis